MNREAPCSDILLLRVEVLLMLKQLHSRLGRANFGWSSEAPLLMISFWFTSNAHFRIFDSPFQRQRRRSSFTYCTTSARSSSTLFFRNEWNLFSRLRASCQKFWGLLAPSFIPCFISAFVIFQAVKPTVESPITIANNDHFFLVPVFCKKRSLHCYTYKCFFTECITKSSSSATLF